MNTHQGHWNQTRFVVTVDTEADDAWLRPDRLALNNLGCIPRFQTLCERYGVVPTYLVAYECATRDEALSVLKPLSDQRRCEIGHHLHCWSTPPFQNESPRGIDRDWLHAYQYELPDSLFFEKAEALRSAIEQFYGLQPTSHRAGRWGIDLRTLNWLAENRFVVDSSVIPLHDLRKNAGRRAKGPDFTGFSYRPARVAWAAGRGSGLLEIPVSVELPGSLTARVCAAYLKGPLPGKRLASGLIRSAFLRGGRKFCPDPRYPLKYFDAFVEHAWRSGDPVINLSLHSSELSLGHSPFSRDAANTERVWAALETVFAAVLRLQIQCFTLSDAASLLNSGRFLPSAGSLQLLGEENQGERWCRADM